MPTFNFRNKEKIGYFGDHKSQQKGLGGWKMPPTHTHTSQAFIFHDFRHPRLIRDLTKCYKILDSLTSFKNANYSLILITVLNLDYKLISKKVTSLIQLKSLDHSINPNYHVGMHKQFTSVKRHYKNTVTKYQHLNITE